MKKSFHRKEKGMHLLLGIGNGLLADDGIGCMVAGRLHHPDWQSVNAGTVPENFTRLIRESQPDILLLVDAAQMNLPPGSMRIIPQERVADAGLGTHQLPLDALCDVVSSYCGRIVIIGIQPDIVEIGEEMTRPVIEAGIALISQITDGRYLTLPVYDVG